MLVQKRDALELELIMKIKNVLASGKDNEVKHFVSDSAEDADKNSSDDVDGRIYKIKRQELTRIEEAIQRLDEGKYGVCFDCGETIGLKRLEALPFATRCKDCEERKEETESRTGKHPQITRPFFLTPDRY